MMYGRRHFIDQGLLIVLRENVVVTVVGVVVVYNNAEVGRFQSGFRRLCGMAAKQLRKIAYIFWFA
jgi:hypothetical protein